MGFGRRWEDRKNTSSQFEVEKAHPVGLFTDFMARTSSDRPVLPLVHVSSSDGAFLCNAASPPPPFLPFLANKVLSTG